MKNQSDGPTFCGGFTYNLVYAAGPLSLDTDLPSYAIEPIGVDRHQVRGTATHKKWLGTHRFVLRGTNGSFDSSPQARGVDGLFKSVVSDQIEVKIVDPCIETLLNPNGALQIPTKLNVPPGEV